MRKALTMLALAAVPILATTACNGPSNGTAGAAIPSAPQTRLHQHDFSANDLHAGGATFPAYAYNLGNQPAGLATAPQAPPGTGSLFATPKLGGATVYYCLTGSGTGRGIFTTGSKSQTSGTATTTGPCAPLGATPTGFGARQDPPDFAGSDVALSSGDYNSYKTTREPVTGTNWGEPLEFPVLAGPIVYSYRPQDFPKQKTPIQLSRWTYCAIANGTISDWSDPAIKADNNGVSPTQGVSEPITFYFRSDGSGTSYNYTFHLNQFCGSSWHAPYNAAPYEGAGRSAAWTYGVNQTWPGPGSSKVPNAHFIGESGNPGVLAAIQSTPFATGYLEGAWAKSANPPVAQAWLQGRKPFDHKVYFVDPTVAANTAATFANVNAASIVYGEGSDGVPLATSRPECILYLDPGQWNGLFQLGHVKYNAYPIMAVSYLMFYGHNNGVKTSEKAALISFLTHVNAVKIESKLEYTPLSPAILKASFDAAYGIGTGKAPCLQ